MAALPIWKDKIVAIGGATMDFQIKTGGTVIYSGRAYKRPGAVSTSVRVNDVCADFLENVLPTLTDRHFTSFGLPSFVLEVYAAGTWSTITTLQFYNDWSYDYGFTGNVLSDPINGRVTKDMFILSSAKELSGNVNASYRTSGGTITSRTATVSPTPNHGTCCFNAGAVASTVRITINSKVYQVVDACSKYALYYVNAYGGWDQFLIEGNDMETDSLQRFIREQEYDNNSIVNAGKVNYVSEVTKSWTLHSGLLSDTEASRMHHLLNSNLVYLCDIATKTFIPVIIKTDTCEYKTYKNQGRTMVDYSFNIELAQNRIRR